jgi:hypothetical protein
VDEEARRDGAQRAQSSRGRREAACNKAGKYQCLYEYLENRYANTVVLTFAQIEDLLGFTLPDPARNDQDWWAIAGMNTAEAPCSDAWTLACRKARPNLLAQTVAFERAS